MIDKAFADMSKVEQVDFFVHCQQLLVAYHPESPFICRKDNIKERLAQMKQWVQLYKGMCYWDDHVCTLYNRIVVNRVDDPAQALKANLYKPPAEHYNTIVIDFAAFRDIKDCISFVQTHYETKLQYILFVKHNKVKLYPTAQFVSQLLNMPIV